MIDTNNGPSRLESYGAWNLEPSMLENRINMYIREKSDKYLDYVKKKFKSSF